jgi:VWFA-related protein
MICLGDGIAFTLLAIAAAQKGAAQDAPTFRAGTHLVQVNVLVNDRNGPVANLKQDDFALTDKGKPQKISVFSSVVPTGAQPSQAVLPAGTFSNRMYGTTNPASVTVVLLDRLNTLAGGGNEAYEDSPAWLEDHALGFAKQQLVRFVKEMQPQDRVAVYSLAETLTVLSDFTGDRDQLLQVLNHYKATSVTSREKADPGEIHTPAPCCFDASIDRERQVLANFTNVNRAQITLSALAGIAAHLAAVPGRKNLVWLTADLPFPAAAVARLLERSNVAVYPMDARGLISKALFNRTDDTAHVPGLGGRAVAGDSRPRGQDAMEEIAQATGGRAFINTNNLSEAIRSAVEDSSATYTLGFYADDNLMDGKFHELKIRVKHAHLEVRYPKGYFAFKDDPSSQGGLMNAAQSPLEAAGIHVVARVELVEKSISISGSIDLRDLELAQSREMQQGSATIVMIQQDAAGREIGRESNVLNLQLSKENYPQILKTGVFFRRVVEPKDGLATLRILVADAGGTKTGSLIIPISRIQ